MEEYILVGELKYKQGKSGRTRCRTSRRMGREVGISKDIIVIAKHIVDNEMRQSAKTTRGVCEKILVQA